MFNIMFPSYYLHTYIEMIFGEESKEIADCVPEISHNLAESFTPNVL